MDYSYESSELFLSIVQLEYQNEFDRTKVIDSKIAVALPIISTYFFLAVQFSSMKKLLDAPISSQSLLATFIDLCIPTSYIVALGLASISLLFMFMAISTHSYKTIDSKQFNTASQMSMSKDTYSAAFATIYINATEANRLKNDIRARRYMKGWRYAFISLFCFVIHVLLTQ